MFCKYSFTNATTDTVGRHPIYCKLTNNTQCPLIRYCSIVGDFINIDNIDKNCTIYLKGEDLINMKNGELRVLFVKRGNLYVELDKDTVIAIANPYNYEPKYVEVVMVKNEYYVKGFEPKKEIKEVKQNQSMTTKKEI